jgi:uncharacterized protein YlaI
MIAQKMQLVDQPFKCVHCSKTFMKEKTLVAHMCEQKRRVLQKTEKRVQTGFFAYNRFYQLTQAAKKQKSYSDFCKSAYYNAFVKFGSFINNVDPLYPERFIEFVIKSGVKLDHWCRDELYDKYLTDLVKIEPVESAVQRSLQYMMEWGDEQSADFAHYFNYVNVNRAVHHIREGKISPWMVMNTSSGVELLKKFNDEQLELVNQTLDIAYWAKKIRDNPADVALVKEVCKEVGIE